MRFNANGSDLGYTFVDFCDWAACNRRNKTVLQMLMEYLVSKTLGCVEMSNETFVSNGSELLRMRNGKKIAVCVGSYVGSLYAEHPDWISFDIPEEYPDVFIFCVNCSMSMFSIPTNLDIWDFYVLSGSMLSLFRKADVLTLPALQLMNPVQCDFNGIQQAIASV